MTFASWRDMSKDAQVEYITDFVFSMRDRFAIGDAEYHSSELGFQGDPLEHSWEEGLDKLFYIWKAKKQRDYERGFHHENCSCDFHQPEKESS